MSKAIRGFLSLLLFTGLALHLVFWAFIIIRIVTVPENHIGVDITAFNFLSYGLIGFALLVGFIRRTFYIPLVAVVLALASLGGIHYVDKNNLMLQYEQWLSRGIPEKRMLNKVDSGR